jgi:Transglycosylase SLT domain
VTRVRAILVSMLIVTVLQIAGNEPAVQAQTAAVSLSPGWNNVLYTGTPGAIATVLAPLANNLTEVLIWDSLGQRWHAFYPGNAQASDLQAMLPGQVYWVAVQSAATLPSGIAMPSPTQILPGWNNVAYLGAGAPGSTTLEQSPVWTWDATSQRWLFRDPLHADASDFQSLSPLRAYWMDLPGATAQPSSSPPSPSISGSCFGFASTQPSVADIEDAISRASNADLHVDPALELPSEHLGPDGSVVLKPGYVPQTILRGIAWAESSWHQSTYDTPRGHTGPTLASSGCAYGLMQIASGMSIASTPTNTQQVVGADYRANAEAGAQLLAKNWNEDASTLPIYGRHDPHIIEDWYFAIWAYHCFGDSCSSYGAHDDPDDPSLPWPRPAYNSQQQTGSTSLSASDYPYEELIFGLIGNPPLVDGRQEWQPIALQLPAHGAVGFPTPHSVAEASAHLENGASATVSSPQSVSTAGLIPAGAPQIISPSGSAVLGSP